MSAENSSNSRSTNQSSTKKFYSSHRNPDLIHQATLRLLETNIENLLGDIYDPSNDNGIFGHPEVRVGLSLKLLNNIRIDLDKSVIKPIIRDIERLMNDEEYLNSTGDADRRYRCLQSELDFVQRYIDLDDSITLNTVIEPELVNDSKKAQEGCIIQ
jgi:hypothetical protein